MRWCVLIRGLHVSHFFEDANGRLNTMLLLNRLLVEEGFPPVIMDDTSIFGGGFTASQLIGQVRRGVSNFGKASGLGVNLGPAKRDYGAFVHYEDQ